MLLIRGAHLLQGVVLPLGVLLDLDSLIIIFVPRAVCRVACTTNIDKQQDKLINMLLNVLLVAQIKMPFGSRLDQILDGRIDTVLAVRLVTRLDQLC